MNTVSTRPSKIICVGRNYAEHAKELGNAVPDATLEQPILFIKPPSSLESLTNGITLPDGLGECHFECELSVQIGTVLKNASSDQAKRAISGVTLGLDLTLRELQNSLKSKGQPWERAKAFDGACLLGDWLSVDVLDDLENTHFEFLVNGEIKQKGNTSDMIYDVIGLIAHISETFTLEVGDVIMTGTPAGVSALHAGDQLIMSLHTVMGAVSWRTHVNQ